MILASIELFDVIFAGVIHCGEMCQQQYDCTKLVFTRHSSTKKWRNKETSKERQKKIMEWCLGICCRLFPLRQLNCYFLVNYLCGNQMLYLDQFSCLSIHSCLCFCIFGVWFHHVYARVSSHQVINLMTKWYLVLNKWYFPWLNRFRWVLACLTVNDARVWVQGEKFNIIRMNRAKQNKSKIRKKHKQISNWNKNSPWLITAITIKNELWPFEFCRSKVFLEL